MQKTKTPKPTTSMVYNRAKFIMSRWIPPVLLSLFLLFAGASCDKESKLLPKRGTVKSHASAAFYDQKLLDKFMKEPLVLQFDRIISSYKLSVNNGILSFKNKIEFNEVYDTLVYFSNQWDEMLEKDPKSYAEYIESEAFPCFPMLFAFEVFTNFYSLRASIEVEMFRLQEKEGITEANNPDNHFTVSDFLRTLLSPDCETIIGNWIVLYGRDQSLIIQNLDFKKLEEVKSLRQKYGETEGTLLAFTKQLAIDIEEGDWGRNKGEEENPCPDCRTFSIIAYPSYNDANKCPHTYKFVAAINGVQIDLGQVKYPESLCDVVEITWNFGDGQSEISTRNNPTHTYGSDGTYGVKAIVKRRNGTTCTATLNIVVKDCAVTLSAVKNTSYQSCESVQYQLKATPFHCISGQKVKDYKLSFQNSAIPAQNNSSGVFSQIFTCDDEYMAIITATFQDGCTSQGSLRFKVTGTGDCKKRSDHEKVKDIYTCGSDYKINHKFTVWSKAGLNRVYVKNVHYKKNKYGNWIWNSPTNMEVSFWGKVVYEPNDCTVQTPVYPNGKTNKNWFMILYDYPMRQKFYVSRESLHSSWKVKSTKNCNWASNSDEIQLHSKDCK